MSRAFASVAKKIVNLYQGYLPLFPGNSPKEAIEGSGALPPNH